MANEPDAEDCSPSPVPQYADVLRHVIAPLKWNLDEFRLFSCEFIYPLYGSHVMMVLEP